MIYISLQDIFNADNKRGSYYLAFGKFSCFISLHNLSQEHFKKGTQFYSCTETSHIEVLPFIKQCRIEVTSNRPTVQASQSVQAPAVFYKAQIILLNPIHHTHRNHSSNIFSSKMLIDLFLNQQL